MSSLSEIRSLTEEHAQLHSFTEEEIEAILFPSTNSLTMAEDPDVDLGKSLKSLHQRRTRYQLHGSTLSEYVRSKRIPRGLRIQKMPTIGRGDEEFCRKWCEILNKASLDLTVLVIEFTQKELTKVNEEIESVEEKLKTKTSEADFTKIKDDLNTMTEKYQQELQKMKIGKFKRDTLDYKEGRVYPWLSRPVPTKTFRAARPPHRDSHSSISSTFPSESDEDFLDKVPTRKGQTATSRRGGRRGGAAGARSGLRTRNKQTPT